MELTHHEDVDVEQSQLVNSTHSLELGWVQYSVALAVDKRAKADQRKEMQCSVVAD